MPNKQTSMQKSRQVLRCYVQGKEAKAMSSMLSISCTTIKKYLQKFQTLDLSNEEALELSDSELAELFQDSHIQTSSRSGEAVALL